MNNHLFAEFPAENQKSLPRLCLNLLRKQKLDWPELGKSYVALSTVRSRAVMVDKAQVELQFNPNRACSSGAAVDKESIKKRPCFLCLRNLPAEQKGILYRDDLLILCNPAPIFDRHFTIAHKEHIPQMLTPFLSLLLDLSRDLAPDYAAFYNGPACGASAPDHLHFQAVPLASLPLMNVLSVNFGVSKKISDINIYAGLKSGRGVIILEGENKHSLQEQLEKLLKILPVNISSGEEPLINVICSYGALNWRIVIFPRRKHRPDAYYLEGENRIFVSPGAIDMAGVIITPLDRDFQRLGKTQIRSLYNEVSAGKKEINRFIKALQEK